MLRRISVSVVAGAVVGVLGVSPAFAASAGGRLTISPTSGPVGTTIQVSGTGCTTGGVVVTAVQQNGGTLQGAQPAQPDAQGNWQSSLIMYVGLDPKHSYQVTAKCFTAEQTNPQIAFTYTPQPFDLTAAGDGGQPSVVTAGTGGLAGERGGTRDVTLPLVGVGVVLTVGSALALRRARAR